MGNLAIFPSSAFKRLLSYTIKYKYKIRTKYKLDLGSPLVADPPWWNSNTKQKMVKPYFVNNVCY